MKSDITAGLAVLVEPEDATLALELAGTKRWLTLVLTSSDATAKSVRRAVQQEGAQGLVTVGTLADGVIPLADHMANLVVVESRTKVDEAEALRVLVPVRGLALIRKSNRWKKLTKEMPPNLDGWTHFFHGADGNKVSADDRLQVPNGLRFIAGPRLQDSNGANGWRIDDGIAASEWKPTLEDGDRYHEVMMVEGRDAFNGFLLWQRGWSRCIPVSRARQRPSR